VLLTIQQLEFLIFASAVVEYATEEGGRGLRRLLLLHGVGLWSLFVVGLIGVLLGGHQEIEDTMRMPDKALTLI
jgi:hypothetical protein